MDHAIGTEIVRVPFDRPGVSRFLRVAYLVYRHDRLWVAPLESDALLTLSSRNPFYQHARIELWIARAGGRDVGRIAAIVDDHFHPPSGQPTAFFGYFECIDDPGISGALLRTVKDWARARGLERVLGPMNPSANDECGLLVQGFDTPPALMTTYNPPYYARLIEAAGFQKAKDLLAFDIQVAGSPAQRMERVALRFEKRNPELELRPVLKRTLDAELPHIKRIYNESWEKNWGFTPMTDAEIDFLAVRLKPLLTEGLVWIATQGGEPAGFLLIILDYNQVLQPLRGRLLSRGLFRALPYLLNLRTPDACRVIALGVRPEFRRRGIETVMLHRALQTVNRLKLQSADASWVLEENIPVQQTIAHQGGKVSKVYRLYESGSQHAEDPQQSTSGDSNAA